MGVIKALKEPLRDRKKVKHVKHSGDLTMNDIIEIARVMSEKSNARDLRDDQGDLGDLRERWVHGRRPAPEGPVRSDQGGRVGSAHEISDAGAFCFHSALVVL